jgi:hypothetical protein
VADRRPAAPCARTKKALTVGHAVGSRGARGADAHDDDAAVAITQRVVSYQNGSLAHHGVAGEALGRIVAPREAQVVV